MPNHFDTHAKNYDSVFTYSQIGKAQRKRVYKFMEQYVLRSHARTILELNCGTGEDAYYFQQKGHRVLATDVSEKMIETAKAKFPDVSFSPLDITQLSSTTFSKKFDLIFSNFGGLNCLSPEQLNDFLLVSSTLLTTGGKLALVLMPKKCVWERVYFWLKGDRKKANRRNTEQKVWVHVEGIQVPTWYYNPEDIQKSLSDTFETIALKPIGIAIPPSYMESFFQSKPILLGMIKWLEKLFSTRILAKYADHYLIVLEKKEKVK